MQSLKELYKIGNGPSSSHTMGPKRACEMFKNQHKDADKFKVILYGSLALTGKGHLTDYIIRETLKEYDVEIEFDKKTKCKVHPNTFDISAYKNGKELELWRVYSVGGGTFRIEGQDAVIFKEIYKEKNFEEIKKICVENKINLYDYVCKIEGKEEITRFLEEVWQAMQDSIKNGLTKEGEIPRKA